MIWLAKVLHGDFLQHKMRKPFPFENKMIKGVIYEYVYGHI